MENRFLTEKDLNEFKLEITNMHNKLNNYKEDIYLLKKDKNNNKEEIGRKILEYRELRKKYLEFTKTKKFKTNYKLVKKAIKNKEVEGKSKKEALMILRESKLTIKEYGAGASLSRLNDTAIKIENLAFRYSSDGPLVLNNVTLDIKHGEYVTIVGHNGSGKSTLSKVLIGVLQADAGVIEMFGNRVTKSNTPQVRKFLGIVFQNPDNQFIGSTVEADIAFGLENKRVDPKEMRDIIINSAKKVDMDKFLSKEPLNLSGGQKQRVAIASALALDPDIMIFDEATSMLDPKGKREIKEIMVELRNKGDKTIISITHDMDEILNADKVIIMNHGKIIKVGNPIEITSDREFLRSMSLDVPFVGTVEESLENEGIKITPSKNIDELVEKICKK